MDSRIFSFPRMGKYTEIFKEMFQGLGLEVILPPEISERTIQHGVKHSPDMMCYPFKVTLGQLVEAVNQGATDVVMYNNCGNCRARQYYILQDLILKTIGHRVTMHQLRPTSLMKDMKSLNPENSVLHILRVLRNTWKSLQQLENTYHQEIDPDQVNIAVIGEIYVVLEPFVNLNLFRKLQMKGVRTHTFLNIVHLITDRSFLFRKKEDPILNRARHFLDGEIGGHGIRNIRDSMYAIDHQFDGIIHLVPLSCMPEVTIEPVINVLCSDSKTPLLRLHIDETNSETNVDTRLETFIELIKRKKRQSNISHK